jgi:NAD-dependent DNA ligase
VSKGNTFLSPKDVTGDVYCHSNCRIDEKTKQKIMVDGGSVVDSFSSKVTILVVDSLTSTSSKIKKAKEKNLPIITITDLYKKYESENKRINKIDESISLF